MGWSRKKQERARRGAKRRRRVQSLFTSGCARTAVRAVSRVLAIGGVLLIATARHLAVGNTSYGRKITLFGIGLDGRNRLVTGLLPASNSSETARFIGGFGLLRSGSYKQWGQLNSAIILSAKVIKASIKISGYAIALIASKGVMVGIVL